MKGMIPPIQWETVKESLNDITLNVLKTLFVPIPEDENVQSRTCQIYGIPGTGKTSLFRWFGLKGLQHYKQDNINLIESTNLDVLLDSIEPVPVNFLFLDDAGLETQKAGKDLIAKFSQVRHIHEDVLEDKGMERKGVDDIFFNVQAPFLLDKHLRNTLHVELYKNCPTNNYDKGILVKNIGRKAVEQLEHINRMVFQQHKYEYLSHCVARAIDMIGTLNYDFIPAKDSVIKRLETKITLKTGDIENKPIRIAKDMDFYDTLVKSFVFEMKKKYDNEEYILAAFCYRNLLPIKLSFNKIFKRLKKIGYDMIASRGVRAGEEMRAGSLNTVVSDFEVDYLESFYITLGKTATGKALEVAIRDFLNSKTLHKTFFHFGEPGLPDLLLGSDFNNRAQLALNCKFKETFRSSWEEECTPENDYADCWLAHYTPHPEAGLKFYHNEQNELKLSYTMQEGKSCEEFLEHVRKYYSTTINCPECGKPMTTEDHHFYHCSNCPTTFVPDSSIFFDEGEK